MVGLHAQTSANKIIMTLSLHCFPSCEKTEEWPCPLVNIKPRGARKDFQGTSKHPSLPLGEE